MHDWLDAVIDGPVAAELTSLVGRLDQHARSDSLGQKLIALTAPGVPDVYQGTELWDDSLVDPDNRRPVDFDARREALMPLEPPQDPGRDGGAAAAPRPPADVPGGRLHAGARRRAGRRTPRRVPCAATDVLVAVSRLDGPARRNRLGRHAFWPSRDGTWHDRHRRWRSSADRLLPADLFAELPVALLERVGA